MVGPSRPFAAPFFFKSETAGLMFASVVYDASPLGNQEGKFPVSSGGSDGNVARG